MVEWFDAKIYTQLLFSQKLNWWSDGLVVDCKYAPSTNAQVRSWTVARVKTMVEWFDAKIHTPLLFS